MNPLAKYLTDYLINCNKLEIAAESIRQSMVSNPYFQVASVFERMDKFRKGYLEPADFSEFMLENQVYPSEVELYLIFKDFDKFKRGLVRPEDLEAELLPREHQKLRKAALQRQPYPVDLRLSLDLEYLLARYFQDKIKSIAILNEFRTRIRLIKPTAVRDAFKLIDTRSAGYIMRSEQIDTFLRNNGKALNQEELQRIFRVLSSGHDCEISVAMFIEHLDPMGAGTYTGYRQKMVQKEALEKTYLAKKYELQALRSHNIVEADKLSYEITQLRESNRRLRSIMDQQQLIGYEEQRRWNGHY